MARTWARSDLTGTRNGVNTSFTVPNYPPTGTVTVWVIYNGRVLFQVSLSPNPLQYTRTGNAVVVGLAPASTDTLWAYVVADDAMPQTAIVQLHESRRTFYYQAEARDKSDVLQKILEHEISASRWSYYPVGGCGEAEIQLRVPFDDIPAGIDLDWDIQIWREIDVLGQAGARLPAQFDASGNIQLGTAHHGTRQLRYSGFVREIQRDCSDDEHVTLRCSGYSRQLAYIIVPEQATPWTSMDVGAIVRAIIQTYVVPGTKIVYDASLIPDTGVILDSFNVTDQNAWDMLSVLAAIAGNAEFGVRADRRLYFFQPTQTARQTHVIGDRVVHYRPSTNTDDIVKTVFLRGANGFKAQLNHGTPESGFYKQRREFVASIQTPTVATLWGTAYFEKHGQNHPSGDLELGATDDWIENVGHPLGLLRVIGGPVFVSPGDPLPAQLPMKLGVVYGKYTDESFRIASVSYQPTDDALSVQIGLGERKSPLADLYETLSYKLSELAQAV